MMDNILTLISHIQNTVRTKIVQQQHLLVAYSGGVDSSVLLHVLVMLRQQLLPNLQLTAIHIHHGISKQADHWAEHCRQQCHIWRIPCIIEQVTLALTEGNVEEQARKARYQAIIKHLTAHQTLCTAQHLDDQAETFLLALKRGSGPTGLSAMPEHAVLAGNSLLRPLLTISRQQIERYAKACQLSWVEDESNQDAYYDRNFLRLDVLPILKQRWPQFNQMVARSAELCNEQQQLLDELLADCFVQLIDKQNNLLLAPLSHYSCGKRNALLRMWFKLHQVTMPSRKQLDVIWQTVVLAKEDSNPLFMLHNKQIRRYQETLYLLPQYADLRSIKLEWQEVHQPLLLPDGLGQLVATTGLTNRCRLPKSTEQVKVAFGGEGRYQIVGRQGSRSIKKLWQEFGIAPWMRTRIPLVFYNQILITAVGVFVTEQGQGNEICYHQNG